MARVVTPKIAGIILSSVILFFITLMLFDKGNSNQREWTFSSSITYKGLYFERQSRVLGNDDVSFLDVYLKPDKKYLTVRVMIDEGKSYLKNNWNIADLKHELYRANLAAVVARELNEFIVENSVHNRDEFLKLFKEYDLKFRQLDKQYKEETAANTVAQDYWEYKIDSMYYAHDKLDVKDQFSGISCYFPLQPVIKNFFDSVSVEKEYSLEKYNMFFGFCTGFYYYGEDYGDETEIDQGLRGEGYVDVKVKQYYDEDNRHIYELEYTNTFTNEIYFGHAVYIYPYRYHLTVRYPHSGKNNVFYERIKNQFFSSMNIEWNDDYWIERANKMGKRETERYTAKPAKNNKNKSGCLVYRTLPSLLFHRGIIQNDRRKIIIPFYSVKHKSEEMEELVLILNDEDIFSQKPEETDQMIIVDLDDYGVSLKPEGNEISFGYTLKSDSIKECYDFYSLRVRGCAPSLRCVSECSVIFRDIR